MKKLFVYMLLLICALTACDQSVHNGSGGDVLFLNCTDAAVYSVGISWDDETVVGQNADGTALGRYEYLTFDMEDVPATVTAYDIDGTKLASCTITEQTQGRWGVHLICDAAGNYKMEAKAVVDLDQSGAFVAGTGQTWQGVVTELCMAKVRGVPSEWSFLVPSRATICVELEDGRSRSCWESDHYHFPSDISLGDYVKVESAIERSSGLLVATGITVLKKHTDIN